MGARDRSERIVETLRREPPALDDVAKARMEKRLVDAVRTAERARPEAGRGRGGAMIVAATLAVAAVVGLVVWRMNGQEPEVPGAGADGPAIAVLESPGGEAVRQDPVVPGQTVETARQERVRVRIGRSEVRVDVGSRARFARIDARNVEVSLERGRIDVGFHPERRGEQRMTVQTPAARVEVVGTVFRVVVGAGGETTVSVSEGTVRVVPRHGGDARLVHAGEASTVPARAAATATATATDTATAAATDTDTDTDTATATATDTDTDTATDTDTDTATDTDTDTATATESAADARLARLARLELEADRAEARHDYVAASRAYDQAYTLARAVGDQPRAANAIYAHARMRAEKMGDRERAIELWRRYEATPGAAAHRYARQQICALGGEEDYCR